MRGRLLQPFVLLFSVPRGLSRYDSSFTRVTERRMPPKKKLKALADEKQKMLTDLFSTASIKTSRTSSEPTATTSGKQYIHSSIMIQSKKKCSAKSV